MRPAFADRICPAQRDDRDRARRGPRCLQRHRAAGEDQVHLRPDEFVYLRREAVDPTFGVAALDGNIAPIFIAEGAQTVAQFPDRVRVGSLRRVGERQCANSRHRGAGRLRVHSCGVADDTGSSKRDDDAPAVHVSESTLDPVRSVSKARLAERPGSWPSVASRGAGVCAATALLRWCAGLGAATSAQPEIVDQIDRFGTLCQWRHEAAASGLSVTTLTSRALGSRLFRRSARAG